VTLGQAPSGQPPSAQPQIPATALALVPKSAARDTLHMQSHLASFKIVPRGPEVPAGRLEFSFSGTVMVNGLAPGSYLATTGNVRKEYDHPEHGRLVYFGKGKILIVGRFKGCQWFGRDLDLTFKGAGIVRFVAEFDKNLETGSYWFDPKFKNPMDVNLWQVVVPQPIVTPEKAITREEFERQKKQKGGG
ncbi:MAG: hypothetical protein ACHQ50_18205, partial [Fimbriimonadales bacterium]